MSAMPMPWRFVVRISGPTVFWLRRLAKPFCVPLPISNIFLKSEDQKSCFLVRSTCVVPIPLRDGPAGLLRTRAGNPGWDPGFRFRHARPGFRVASSRYLMARFRRQSDGVAVKFVYGLKNGCLDPVSFKR